MFGPGTYSITRGMLPDVTCSFFCRAHGSTLLNVLLCSLSWCAHWSAVAIVLRSLFCCAQCSAVLIVLLYSLFCCGHCPALIVLLCPMFCHAHCSFILIVTPCSLFHLAHYSLFRSLSTWRTQNTKADYYKEIHHIQYHLIETNGRSVNKPSVNRLNMTTAQNEMQTARIEGYKRHLSSCLMLNFWHGK